MADLSPEMCRGLPKTPCMFNSSELLFAIVHRMVGGDLRQPLNPAKKHLVTTLCDEIRQPGQQPLRLTIPTEERLARVAGALLDDVADDRTLEAWADVAGMARRTFMRAFSAPAGMSFGRWRQQARLFARAVRAPSGKRGHVHRDPGREVLPGSGAAERIANLLYDNHVNRRPDRCALHLACGPPVVTDY